MDHLLGTSGVPVPFVGATDCGTRGGGGLGRADHLPGTDEVPDPHGSTVKPSPIARGRISLQLVERKRKGEGLKRSMGVVQ